MTNDKRLDFVEVEHSWGTTHHFEYDGNRIQEYEVAEMFNEIYEEKEELKEKVNSLKHQLDVCKYHRISDANRMTDLEKKIETLEDANEGLVGTIAHFDIEEVL